MLTDSSKLPPMMLGKNKYYKLRLTNSTKAKKTTLEHLLTSSIISTNKTQEARLFSNLIMTQTCAHSSVLRICKREEMEVSIF